MIVFIILIVNIEFLETALYKLIYYSERSSDFIISARAKRALRLLTTLCLRQLRNSRLHMLGIANDVMEHFAFPGNIDFAADDQGAF